MAWRAVTNPLEPVRVLTDDHVEHIHLSSLRLLASTGMRVLHAGAHDVLAAAGCEVDDIVVRFDPDLITEVIAAALPSSRCAPAEAGSVDATERAHRIWRSLLADYEQPPLDAAIDEALTEFVAKRKEQSFMSRSVAGPGD